MQQKYLYWLGGALAALVGIALLTGVFEGDPSTLDVPRVELDADRIEALRIERTEDPLTLVREDGRWRLAAPVEGPADSATVSQLVRQLGDLQLASVVSTSPGRYARYGVDSTAQVLVVRSGARERRLVVNTEGPDYRSAYVRVDDDPRVFATAARLDVPAGLDRWRDKTIVGLVPASVTSVAVERPDGAYEVRRSGDRWELVRDGQAAAADSAAVERWLARFDPLRADGFVPELQPDAVRDSTTHRLAFRRTDGDATLWLRSRDDGNAAVTTDAGDAIFRVAAYRLDQIAPEPSTLATNPE